ncbi:hypothetical protein JVU11DRAFT_11398 [Chiua virens]|nr:hypothetical protein JVU11DRAFT_11398 [Chiua virens]
MSDTLPDTSTQLNAEQAWMAGALIITRAGYGVVATLFWLCLVTLWNRLKIKDTPYTTLLFPHLRLCNVHSIWNSVSGVQLGVHSIGVY